MIQEKKMDIIKNILKIRQAIAILLIILLPTVGIFAQKATPGKTPAKETAKETVEKEEKEEAASDEAPPAAFGSAKLIHAPSTTPVDKKTLDFRVNHRFGSAKDTLYDFGGLDKGATTEISLDYGITDKFSVGLARMNTLKTYEARTKFTFLTQSDKMPISMAFSGAIGMENQKNITSAGNYTASYGPYVSPTSTGNTALDTVIKNELNSNQMSNRDRTSFFGGLLISKRFGETFSLQVSPLFVHKNYAKYQQSNDRIGMDIGGSIKITDDIRFVFEGILTKHRDYIGENYNTVDQTTYGGEKKQLTGDEINKSYNLNNPNDVAYIYTRNVMYDKKVPHMYVPFSFGISYDTGGHLFQLFVTNMRSLAFTRMLDGADLNYKNKDWTVGFNINRGISF